MARRVKKSRIRAVWQIAKAATARKKAEEREKKGAKEQPHPPNGSAIKVNGGAVQST